MQIDRSLIVGLGKTGQAFADYLTAKNMNFDFADTREKPPMLQEVKAKYSNANVYLGEPSTDLLDNYQQLLLSPGVDTRLLFIQEARNKGIPIQGDIGLFAADVDAKIIGITGSNGKSTLTSLLGYAFSDMGLNSAIGGNIGTAALSLLAEPKCDIYILEISSFQLDVSQDLALEIAIVLNVSEDHMDRYDSYADYIDSKASIYSAARIKVVNLDDAICRRMLEKDNDHVISFSMQDIKADIFFNIAEQVFYVNGKCVATAKQFLLKGLHNYQNILAALAIVHAMKIDLKSFISAASQFKGLPHRCEFVATIDEISWVNDSKATNVGAAIAAMQGFTQDLHVIMGGQAKAADFSVFNEAIPANVKNIILMGEDAEYIHQQIPKQVNVIKVDSMEAAVTQAKELSREGDIVLLSPACASLDMYAGFADRGDHYKRLVMEMVR